MNTATFDLCLDQCQMRTQFSLENSEGVLMARGDSAVRFLKVLMYLEYHPAGLTVKEIHEKLKADDIECSERTIYRDLEVIAGAHFPLYSESDQGDLEEKRRWKFRRTTALSEKVHFESYEIFALYLARESLKAMRGSPLIDDILKLTEKLEVALGPGVEKELKNLSKYVGYKAQSTWQTGLSQEILDTVYRACWDGIKLSIEYKSKSGDRKDQIAKRSVGPETLFFAHGGAYLIGRDLSDGKVKTYSLSRIFSAEYTNEEYVSEGFNLEEFTKNNFGVFSEGDIKPIQVHIQEPIASFVSERRWHDSQKITRIENGIELTMNVRINEELARWILGLGPSATVLNPPELVKQVQLMSESISKKYSLRKAS